jgi:hypothetical protein
LRACQQQATITLQVHTSIAALLLPHALAQHRPGVARQELFLCIPEPGALSCVLHSLRMGAEAMAEERVLYRLQSAALAVQSCSM